MKPSPADPDLVTKFVRKSDEKKERNEIESDDDENGCIRNASSVISLAIENVRSHARIMTKGLNRPY